MNYDLMCKSCDQRLDVRTSSIETLAWIKRKAGDLVRVWLVFHDVPPTHLDFHVEFWKNGHLDFPWLAMHWHHELVIVDEYGLELPESTSGGA